ncbi:MAG: PHP domain-containing protein [Chloroflexota bacterium]
MGYADLHIHSTYSPDSATTVRAILKQAADSELDVIAVTDHDEIRGSLEARDLAPQYGIESIPGVEVSTAEGHVIGLFIEAMPPVGASLHDTLVFIGRHGGAAIIPHPFTNLPGSLSMESVLKALTSPATKSIVRGIETHNLGTMSFNGVAQKLSIYLPLARIGASDSHVYWTIGHARTEFPGRTAAEFREALNRNKTTPILDEDKFTPKIFLSWFRYMILRKFGYATDTHSAAQPINTQRMTKSFLMKMKKK